MCRSISPDWVGGLILACILAGLSSTALADAANRSTLAESVTVHFDDLNLDAEAGAKALVSRIAIAATKVCGGQREFRLRFEARARFQSCRTDAMRTAIAEIDHARVTAVYEMRKSADGRFASR